MYRINGISSLQIKWNLCWNTTSDTTPSFWIDRLPPVVELNPLFELTDLLWKTAFLFLNWKTLELKDCPHFLHE